MDDGSRRPWIDTQEISNTADRGRLHCEGLGAERPDPVGARRERDSPVVHLVLQQFTAHIHCRPTKSGVKLGDRA